MTSSIVPSQTAQVLANTIYLLSKDRKSAAFLLVEGATDGRLFANFIDVSSCEIVVCISKDRLTAVCDHLRKMGFDRFIGVLDKDYDELFGTILVSEDIVYTDENDLECTIFTSPALNKVLGEYASKGKLEALEATAGGDFRRALCSAAAILGSYRAAARELGRPYSFDGDLFVFLQHGDFSVDVDETAKKIKNCAANNKIDHSHIDDRAQALLAEHEPMKLCNGHDLIHVLARALRKKIGSTSEFDSDDGRINLERVLRLSYDFQYFQRTAMYLAIRTWEAGRNCRVLRALP